MRLTMVDLTRLDMDELAAEWVRYLMRPKTLGNRTDLAVIEREIARRLIEGEVES